MYSRREQNKKEKKNVKKEDFCYVCWKHACECNDDSF